MSIRHTKWFILGTLVAWLVVDVYLATTGRPTISRVIVDATHEYALPIVAMVNFILGHLVWPQRVKEG